MPDLRANPKDLAALHNALLRFAERQQEAFAQAEDETQALLRAIAEALDAARARERLLNERAQQCYQQAAYVAAAGGWLDCKPIERALAHAEWRVAQLIRAQDLVERAWERYRSRQSRLRDAELERALPRAARYLEAVLNGVEAYLEVRLDRSDEPPEGFIPSPAQTQQYQPTLDELLTKKHVEGELRPRNPEHGV